MTYGEEKLNEYTISKSSTIINIKRKAKIKDEKYEGKNFYEYEIVLDEKILEKIEGKEAFDRIILYESLIYRKDTYNNIKQQIKGDGLKLRIV